MGANVFANGEEVSCEKATNQSLAAMPDVCLSPPSPPAGPVPIPYPNFSSASDTTDGTTTVKIAGGQVGIKNKSCYKQSKGDEAATRSLGMGVVTATIQGKTYFAAWSSDVKFEGENAVRMSDMTTHNHSSDPPNSGSTTVSTGGMSAPEPDPECEALHDANDSERDRLSNATQKADPTKPHQTVRAAASGNTTITHATFNGNPLKAASKAVIHKYDNSFSEGLTAEEIEQRTSNSKVKSKACGGHEYQKTARPHTSHTESRIIETIFGASPPPQGGTLVLAINWPGGENKGKRSCDPCEHCQKLICAVSEPAPGCLKIVICNDKNQREDPDCPPKEP